MKLSNKLKTSQKQKTKLNLITLVWILSFVTIVSVVVFLILNFGNITEIFAWGGGATFTSTSSGGDWATESTWTDGSVPENDGNNIAILNGDISLKGSTTAIDGFTSITLNSGKSFTSGSPSVTNDLSMEKVTFNVANGTIVIYGDLTLTGTNLMITTGSLNVTGTLFINSGTTITVAAGASMKAAALSVSSNSDATLANNGAVTINGNILLGGVINNNSGGIMRVEGNLTSTGSGSSLTANTGNMIVAGSISLTDSSKLYVKQGGFLLVNNNVNVSNNSNLFVGTDTSPLPYSDLVIQKNLIASSTGNVLFDKNSRVAIFGNVSDSGTGGRLFTINNGGQVYIHGNITHSGGGDTIVNNNAVNPFGFYVNEMEINTGEESEMTSNKGSRTIMQTTNLSFYTWVSQQPGSPLFNKLSYFKATSISSNGIKLNWATAIAQSFDKFILERSTDNKNYKILTVIAGGTNAVQYIYKDDDPLNETNYYRLKCMDLGGKFEYSDVLSINFKGVKQLNLFPNPSNGEYINYNINFEPQDDAFTIFDLSENKVGHYKINGNSGIITFDPSLLNGTYIVQFHSGSFNAMQKIIVR